MEVNLRRVGNVLSYKPDQDEDGFKEIGGRKRNGVWLFPAIVASYEGLKRLVPIEEIRPDPQLQEMLESDFGFPLVSERSLWPTDLSELYEYQKLAVRMLVSSPHQGTLLALSPGLGKTATAITAAAALEARSVIITCPKTLIPNWIAEVKEWHPDKTLEVHNRHQAEMLPGVWNVTNLETVKKYAEQIRKYKWDVLIIDESILVKGRNSDRTEAATAVALKAGHRWLLSGVPITKFYDDLFAQFRIANSSWFKSYWRFAATYCRTTETKWGTKVIGNNRRINPRTEFRDLMFIRNHAEVLPDLPKIIHQNIVCDLEPRQWDIYADLRDNFMTQLESGEIYTTTTKVAQLVRLQQVVSLPSNLGPDFPEISGKANTLKDMIRNGDVETPCIVWTHWQLTGVYLAKMLRQMKFKVGLASGAVKDAEAGKAIRDFKSGALDFIVLSLGVGKYGHTLINAKSMVYFDRTWDADAYVQSLARIDGRIGLKHRPVVYTLKVPKTVDVAIDSNLSTKLRSIASLTHADFKAILGG